MFMQITVYGNTGGGWVAPSKHTVWFNFCYALPSKMIQIQEFDQRVHEAVQLFWSFIQVVSELREGNVRRWREQCKSNMGKSWQLVMYGQLV